jgi:hypothetical protein
MLSLKRDSSVVRTQKGYFMKVLKAAIGSFVLALPILSAATFSREIPVPSSDAQTVLHIEHKWLRASVEHDRATLDRILADDFVDSNWKGGLRTKRQVLDKTVAPPAYSQHLRDVKIRIYGSTAIAQGLNEISARDGRIVMRIRFTDVLLYRHGNWQAVAAQETPVSSP